MKKIRETMLKEMKEAFPEMDFSEGTIAYRIVTIVADRTQDQYDSIRVMLDNFKHDTRWRNDQKEEREKEKC